MTLPTNGIATTMGRVSQKLSDTFLKRSSNSVIQTADITGNSRRSKSAVPGWYKRMSMGSNNAPSDTQYAGMSPSARFITSSKNGALVKSTLKNNDVVPKQFLINHPNSMSRSHSDMPKLKVVARARSLPRWQEANTLTDRETDQVNSTDFKPLRSRSSSLIDRAKANLDDTITSMRAEQDIGESLQEMERAIMSGIGRTPSSEDRDLARSFKRTVNINLNDMESVPPDAKKTLSMDINVIVSVKSPENAPKPEIGFQELPGKENEYGTQKYMQSREIEKLDEFTKPIEFEEDENWKITDSEEAENLKFGSDKCLFSQKDITEEIGKVYNFLKKNIGPKSTSRYNSPIRSNAVMNYDAVKKLYVNALGCVKACQELKNNVAMSRNESNTSEFSDIISELEGCFLPDDDDENSQNYLEYPVSYQGRQRKNFLGNTSSDIVGIRMYSSTSDCEKAKKLPCLQSSELSKEDPNAAASAKSVCEKMCMPCCKPARDPPRCFYPYHKPPCKKLKAPRPAFSECKQLFEMKQVTPCECVRPRETRCKKSEDSATCDKR